MPHSSGPQKPAVAMSVEELTLTAESLTTVSERVAFLSEAARVLASSIDYEETFERLTLLLVPRVADWVTINRLLPDGSLERVAHRHADPAFDRRLREMELLPPPRGARVGISHVLRTGESILIPDRGAEYINVLEDAGWDPGLIQVIREMMVLSTMAVPMIKNKDQVIGGITFFTTERSGRHYEEEDLRMAQDLATLAAMAIHNATLHQQAVNDAQKMRVLGKMREDFIRKQVHDLRTPLTALSLLIELMAKSPPSPERIQSLVARARENISRASQMLSNLSASVQSEEFQKMVPGSGAA